MKFYTMSFKNFNITAKQFYAQILPVLGVMKISKWKMKSQVDKMAGNECLDDLRYQGYNK